MTVEVHRDPMDMADLGSPSQGGIYAALVKVAGSMPAIPKDQENREQGFQFRSIGAIVAAAKPLLHEHAVVIVPAGYDVISSDRAGKQDRAYRVQVRGRWILAHMDGSYIVASQVGEAIDYGDKATSKAVQMAFKYMLTQLLGVASEDPDGTSVDLADDVSPSEIAKRRVNALKASMLEAADGDSDAAKSTWEGLLDGLNMDPKTDLDLEAVGIIEQAWNERPS